MTDPIVLGDPEKAEREETLRDGALTLRSRHGLRSVEALLVEALPAKAPRRTLTGFDTEAAVALAARRLWGESGHLSWWHLDAYVGRKAEAGLARNNATSVVVRVLPDLPGVAVPGEAAPAVEEPFDLILLPFPRGQEAILGRELIEEAHDALAPGGRLLCASDDRTGDWLKRVVKEIAGNASVPIDRGKNGLVVVARRTREKRVVRDHRHPLSVTLRGHALKLESRPGVFGHSRLDAGTRALADAFPVQETSVVVDLGCGYGPLGILAARLAPRGRAVLVDSNARATALAARNAVANGARNATVLLRPDLEDLGELAADVVVANPPYFSGFRIARAFVDAALRVLKPGGEVWLVVKAAAEHAAIAAEHFRDVTIIEAPEGYGLVRGRKT